MNRVEKFNVLSGQSFAIGLPSISWQQALDVAGSLVEDLKAREADQVALYCDDSAHFAVSLLACAMAGVDAYLLPDITDDRVQRLHEKCQLVISDQDLSHRDLPQILINVDSELADYPQQECEESITVSLHNIQIVLETSGSSGQAKQLVKNWQQMRQEASVLTELIEPLLPGEGLTICGSVSAQHMYGLTFRIFLAFYLGLAMNRERLLFPETLIDTTHKVGPCIWISSPTLLHTFNENHQWEKARDKVRLIVSSGGSLSAHAKKFLQETLATEVLEIYGSTETGVVASRLGSKYWRFFPSVQSQEDETLGLEITSNWCLDRQYLADAISWREDEFELLGRLDRIIKLADNRVSLLQIEQQLMAHEWIADCYLALHPSKNRVAAWIALNPTGIEAWCSQGRKSVISCIKRFLLQSQVKVALPRYWRFDTELPRNSQGKLRQQDFVQAVLTPIRHPHSVVEQEVAENEYHVKFKVPLDLEYFNGHFDSFHLVPGVVELRWVLDFLRKINWLSQSPRTIENLKFKSFLRPNDVVDITLKRDIIRQKISFSASKGDIAVASGRIVIPTAADCPTSIAD